MPIQKDITKTQLFKVLELLNEQPNLTAKEIAKKTGIVAPSVRRVLHELFEANRLESRYVYRLK